MVYIDVLLRSYYLIANTSTEIPECIKVLMFIEGLRTFDDFQKTYYI